MSYFGIRIPGLKMTVVQADEQNVRRVPVGGPYREALNAAGIGVPLYFLNEVIWIAVTRLLLRL